jgi:hypothetical protein
MTTTFARLKKAGACETGYRTLAKHLVSVEEYGEDKEINLLTILESNGFYDALWCLRATVQDCDKEKRFIACNFAESVLNIFESKRPDDDRPRKYIEDARKFANGELSSEELNKSRDAAYAAAYAASKFAGKFSADDAAAVSDAAYAAAYAAAAVVTAAYDTAYGAAYEAAAVAVAAATYDAADVADDAAATASLEVKKQQLTEIFRKHLQD